MVLRIRHLGFLVVLLSLVSGANITYPKALEYNVSFGFDDPSWKHYITFGPISIINPTGTEQSLNSIYDAPVRGNASETGKLLEAKNSSKLGLEAYALCSEFFVFDSDGSISPGPLIRLVGVSLSKLSSDELRTIMSYNDILGPAFDKIVEEYQETYTYYVEEGNETKPRIGHRTKYRLISYSGSNYIPPEKIPRLLEVVKKIAQMDDDFIFKTTIFGVQFTINAFEMISSGNSCISYGEHFKDSWRKMGELASFEVGRANAALSNLIEMHRSMDYAGLCEENYTGPGADLCNRLREDLGTLASAGKELKVLNEGMANLSGDLPMEAHVRAMMDAAEALENRSLAFSDEYNSTLAELNSTLIKMRMEIEGNLSILKELKARADAQHIQKIRGVLLSGALSGGAKTMEQKFYELEGDISFIERGLKTLDTLQERKPQGYFSRQYALLEEMRKKAYMGEDLVDEARTYLDKLDEHVESYISGLRARGFETSSLESLLNEARSAPTLGERYVLYVRALNKAEEMESDGPAKEDEYNELELKLSELLKKAERDGLNVDYERNAFESIKRKQASYIEKVNDLERLREDILSKARTRFSGLQSLKAELEVLLASGNFEEIEREMKSKESLVFTGNAINYETALGNLLALEEFYRESIDSITSELSKKAELVEVDMDVSTPLVGMDEEGELVVEMYAYNPTPYNLESLEKEVLLEGEFYTDEIDVDRGYVVSSGSSITWYIPYLNAYESISGRIVKRGTFIRVISEESEVVGSGAESVKTRNLTLDVSIKSILEVPCEGCEVYVDGVGRGAVQTVELSTGIHTLVLKERTSPYILEDRTLECTTTGSFTYCKKLLVLEADENIKEVKVTLPLNSTVESLPENAETYGRLLIFRDLEAGENYSVEITERRVDETARIGEIVDYLKRGNLTEDQEAELSQVLSLNISGFKTQALEKAERLYEEVSKEREETEAREREANELQEALNKDLEELDSAIAVGSSLTAELSGKEEELKNTEAKLYDKSWKRKYIAVAARDLWNRFSSIKKSYFKSGVPDGSIEEKFKKFEEEHRKAKGFYSLEALARAAKALDEAEAKIEETVGKGSDISKEFDSFKLRLSNKLSEYIELENSAKKYGVESYLPRSSRYFKGKMNAISSAKDLRQKAMMLSEMENLYKEMEKSINAIKEAAERKVRDAESLLMSKGIPTEEWKNALDLAKESIEQGNYVKALALGEEMSKNAYAYGVEESQDLLPFAALAGVGAVALFLMYRDKLMPKKEVPRRKIRRYGEG